MSKKPEILTLPCGTKVEPVITGSFYEIYRDGDNFIDYKILDHDFVELFDELLEKEINSYTYLSKTHRRIDYKGGYSTYLSWDDVKGWI
jgi:hypothetical protein